QQKEQFSPFVPGKYTDENVKKGKFVRMVPGNIQTKSTKTASGYIQAVVISPACKIDRLQRKTNAPVISVYRFRARGLHFSFRLPATTQWLALDLPGKYDTITCTDGDIYSDTVYEFFAVGMLFTAYFPGKSRVAWLCSCKPVLIYCIFNHITIGDKSVPHPINSNTAPGAK
ncbi:MAG: hypothetical protein LUG27_02955, partial [Clostridiales bacterium]|nr:hypothetical protein [Clostridiales bacterium]